MMRSEFGVPLRRVLLMMARKQEKVAELARGTAFLLQKNKV